MLKTEYFGYQRRKDEDQYLYDYLDDATIFARYVLMLFVILFLSIRQVLRDCPCDCQWTISSFLQNSGACAQDPAPVGGSKSI